MGVQVEEKPRARMVSRNVALPEDMWAWLEDRAARTESRSVNAEVRRVVREAQDEEARETALAT